MPQLALRIKLSDLYEDLQHYRKLANQAIRDQEWDLHMVFGAQYHRTADAIAKLTGQDPRPAC